MSLFALGSSAFVTILKAEPEDKHFRRVIAGGAWHIGWPTVFETRIWAMRNSPVRGIETLDTLLGDTNVATVPLDGVLGLGPINRIHNGAEM